MLQIYITVLLIMRLNNTKSLTKARRLYKENCIYYLKK